MSNKSLKVEISYFRIKVLRATMGMQSISAHLDAARALN